MPSLIRSLRLAVTALTSPLSFASINRVANLLIAYVSTAVGIIATIYLLRESTDGTTLAAAMSTLFIIQLTAGLEPGTVRGLLLRKEKPEDIPIALVLRVSTAKAIIASVAVFGIWWFLWPTAPSLLWLAAISPVITATGFITSDVRSLYEARGRYATGMWSKQGSILIGMFVLSVTCLAGGSVMLAITLSQAARVLLLLPFLSGLAPSTHGTLTGRSVATLLRQTQWQPLAGISLLGALSGSLDRMVVLRYMPPVESAAYLVLYELITKYWLLPYLLAPIMFARRASDVAPDRFRQQSEAILIAGGIALVVSAAVAVTSFPVAIEKFLGSLVSHELVVLMAIAVAINSMAQLLTLDLQGLGRAHQVVVLQAVLLVGSIPLFFGFGLCFGLIGIGIAWLIRTITEYLILRQMDRKFRMRPSA